MSKLCPKNQTKIPWDLAPADVMWAAQDAWCGVWRWYVAKPTLMKDGPEGSTYWWSRSGRSAGHDGFVFADHTFDYKLSVSNEVADKSLRRRPDHVTANR